MADDHVVAEVGPVMDDDASEMRQKNRLGQPATDVVSEEKLVEASDHGNAVLGEKINSRAKPLLAMWGFFG
jgi:hypothetical protein